LLLNKYCVCETGFAVKTFMTEGLTGCNEKIKGFIGRKPVIKKTKDGGLSAYFDISFGLNEPASDKFGTWRHCIAYHQNAETVKDCKPGSYLQLTGWITTNPLYDEHGKKQLENGKPVTREYLIVSSVLIVLREKPATSKQLNLVESGA
jgi:hypothetical protein